MPGLPIIGSVENQSVRPDNPSVLESGEMDSEERLFNTALLWNPLLAAVFCIKHLSLFADNPPVQVINKMDTPQVFIRRTPLVFPSESAGFCMENRAFPTDGPSLCGADKMQVQEPLLHIRVLCLPRDAAAAGIKHRPDADNPTVVRRCKMHLRQRVFRDGGGCPVCPAVIRRQDNAIRADCPPALRINEMHPIEMCFRAARELSPLKFHRIFGTTEERDAAA